MLDRIYQLWRKGVEDECWGQGENEAMERRESACPFIDLFTYKRSVSSDPLSQSAPLHKSAWAAKSTQKKSD